ncbi:MAG: hypothetical protein NT067_06640 [Candidatus Diapherotrites archaeon]|nr:hypothetical protein [Candidatus Diapherotrites archaeon]
MEVLKVSVALIALAAAALLLLFSSGCVSEKEFTAQRLECVELASQAYAVVPHCDSQEECFEALDKNMFGFPEESLDYSVRQELFEFKNRVARSWLYYNRALDRVNEIRSACMDGKKLEELPRLSNELNNFLLMAFEEADKADMKSVSILALESSMLERDEVQKMREEQLFDVFIKIGNNLGLRSSPESAGQSGGYYARLLLKIGEFNRLAEAKGLEPIALQQYGAEDFSFSFAGILGKEFVQEYGKKYFFVPFLGSAFASFVSFLSGSSNLGQSLELLRNSPSFEFLGIYSGLLGEKDSVLAEFSYLLKEDCISRRFVELESEGLEKKIGADIAAAREKIERIPFDEFSFIDENFYFSLYSLLMEEAPFSYREFDFESVREGWQESGKTLESIEYDFHSVVSGWCLQSISLGERATRLKSASFALEELNESLDYIEGGLLDGIVEKCSERIPLLESEAEKTLKSGNGQALLYAGAILGERIEGFKKAGTVQEKIHYCYESLKGLEELEKAQADSDAAEKEMKSSIGSCLDALDFYRPFLKDCDRGLYESIAEFNESLDLGSFDAEAASACNSLLSLAEQALREKFEAESVEVCFANSKELLEKIRLVFSKAPVLEGSLSLAPLEKEALDLGAFFKGKKINLLVSADKMQSVKWRACELEKKGSEGIEKLLSEYLSETAVVRSVPVSGAAVGVEFEDRKIIEFSNPFFSWGKALAVSIPFKHDFDGIKNKSGNVSGFSVKDSIATVQFSFLPEGTSLIEVFSSGLVSFSSEDRLLQLNSESAEIEAKVVFDSKNAVFGIRAEIPLKSGDLAVSGLRAFLDGKGLPVSYSNGNAVLFFEKLEPKSELFVYYALLEPLSVEKILLESDKIDENLSEEVFSVKVSSRLPFKAKDVPILLPFTVSEENLESIALFDSGGTKQKTEFLPGALKFSVDSLEPLQSKSFTLKVRILDESAFASSLLEQAKAKLEAMLQSGNESVRSEAESLLAEIGKTGSLEFRENIARASGLFDSASALEKRAALESGLDSEMQALEKEIQQKSAFLETELLNARSAGFTDLSKEIESFMAEQGKVLGEAEKLKQSDKSKALALLNKVAIAFRGFSPAGASGMLEGEAEKAFNEINTVLLEWAGAGLAQSKISGLKEKANALFEEFKLSGNNAGFEERNAKVQALKETSADLNALFEKELGIEAGKIVEKINAFFEKNSMAKSGLETLKKELESVPSEELVKAKIILPFKADEIDSLIGELQGEESKYKKQFQDLLGLAGKGRNKEMVEKAKGIDFDSLVAHSSEREQVVSAMAESLKSGALASLAEAKNNFGSLDSTGLSALEESVNEARKNNYLKSLLLSRTALASLKQSEGLDFSVLLFPAFVALVILFARAYKKSRRQEKPFYRKIPRQY